MFNKNSEKSNSKKKKDTIIFILVLLLVYSMVSCGYSDDIDETDWYMKVSDWQHRQTECYNYPEPQTVENFSFTRLSLVHLRQVALNDFISAPENIDYWKTSIEAWESEEGDCDTFAFRVWGLLRRFGFPDDSIRLLVMKVAEDCHHMVVTVYYTTDKFYVIDNGAFTGRVLSGEEYLDRFQLEPVIGFNLFSYWDFR